MDQSTLDMLRRIAMVFALGIPLSLCIKHVFERSREVKKAVTAIVYPTGAVLLALYYFLLLPDFKMVSVTRYIAVSAALYAIFVFLPYFYKREHFELYVIKLFIRFLVTALYSGVLFAGMSAILFTIDKLLQIHVDEKMYYYVWLVIAGIFAPGFFLAGIPSFSQQLEREDYSKLLRILLLYIVMPLITAYTTILYIYFAKIIIITLQWPEGLVAHLVLWYSVISAAVIFLTSPLSGRQQMGKDVHILVCQAGTANPRYYVYFHRDQDKGLRHNGKPLFCRGPRALGHRYYDLSDPCPEQKKYCHARFTGNNNAAVRIRALERLFCFQAQPEREVRKYSYQKRHA